MTCRTDRPVTSGRGGRPWRRSCPASRTGCTSATTPTSCTSDSSNRRLIGGEPLIVVGALPGGHRRHHLEGEHRRLLHQEQEPVPVDHCELGVLGGHRGGRSRRGIDECHLAEDVVGGQRPQYPAVVAELDLT